MDLTDIRNAVSKFSEDAPKPMSDKQKVLLQLKGEISKKELYAMTLHQALEILTLILEMPEVIALTRSGQTLTLGELTKTERVLRKPKDDGVKEEPKGVEDDEAEAEAQAEDDDDDVKEEDAA